MKEKRSIKHRYNGQFIAEGECESLAELASKCRARLEFILGATGLYTV